MNAQGRNSGIALITVVCFTSILAILIAGLLSESFTQMKIARRQVGMEQAFYAAEGGVERAVSYICAGGPVPGTITGSIGNGGYITTILATKDMGAPDSTISGSININPNNSPHNSFLLVTADGTTITRDDLHQDQSDRTGIAILVHVQPMGGGNQNQLVVDGETYVLENNTAHTITSEGMTFHLYNDNYNPQDKAVGKWRIALSGSPVSIAAEGVLSASEEIQYSIFSVGIAEGVKRIVVIEGLRRRSWAKYALWYGNDQYGCWFIAGEKFYGPVHANIQVNFSGDPEFFEPLSSSHHTYGGSTNNVTFHKGFELSAPAGTMATVGFDDLRSDASLIVTGTTSIGLSGTNLLVSNSRHGWTNEAVTLSPNTLVYVETDLEDEDGDGDVDLGGTLDGRLTIVAEHDIRITDNIHYAVHPTNNSTDALGLVAGRNVLIATNAPNNTTVHAHIMATGRSTGSQTDGMFYVQDYNEGAPRGVLSVYGGIVQQTRGPVGTFSWWTGNMLSGFSKNYEFDTRFTIDPPPHYPVITNEYTWTSWREMSP